MEAFVTSAINNGVGTITFFHPQGNSMPSAQLAKLTEQIQSLGNDDAVNVIVLKSEGDRTFCAGASFEELTSIKDFEAGKAFFSGFANVINAMRKSPKLIIARVQGRAVGGGVGIAAAADYTFATTAAQIKLSELTIGIGPFVISPAVERKIGTSAFMELSVNASELYTAQWAQQKGLYAQVFDSIADMDTAIETLAHKLSLYNPEAMRLLKQIAWENTQHWDTLLAERAAMSGKLVLSDFTVNALEAFRK
ncbi:enoyl-CoA hydratase/isomerase family protein [Flavobacterium sp. Sd200]|uniref:enoyl-CoA hydratase/isomerase family protein n=1 Tax=Flavobacterium sp. Sd200 TaxID=2692211 RepID=UPI001371F12E|nr:enoyl-CoA hydratase/isomerase family protein [Flavobacterium sp. Sd200]MXN92868.1 enoyl-CoA hydratase/isomerase family protein [Flavobacterium sp. Sd200]